MNRSWFYLEPPAGRKAGAQWRDADGLSRLERRVALCLPADEAAGLGGQGFERIANCEQAADDLGGWNGFTLVRQDAEARRRVDVVIEAGLEADLRRRVHIPDVVRIETLQRVEEGEGGGAQGWRKSGQRLQAGKLRGIEGAGGQRT